MRTNCGIRGALRCAALILCFAVAAAGGGEINSIDDLNGKQLGILAGTMFDNAANAALDFTRIRYFDRRTDIIDALRGGSIDAFIDDAPIARFLAARNPDLFVVSGMLLPTDYAFALRLDDEELFGRINPLVRRKVGDGTVARLETLWVESAEGEKTDAPPPAREGKALRFGVSPDSTPFAYMAGGHIVGLDIDLMRGIAEDLGMRLAVHAMDFSRLVPSLEAGEVDVIGSCFSVTDQRKRIVRFTDSYYRGGAVAVTLK